VLPRTCYSYPFFTHSPAFRFRGLSGRTVTQADGNDKFFAAGVVMALEVPAAGRV
jgi:hypothetical protein